MQIFTNGGYEADWNGSLMRIRKLGTPLLHSAFLLLFFIPGIALLFGSACAGLYLLGSAMGLIAGDYDLHRGLMIALGLLFVSGAGLVVWVLIRILEILAPNTLTIDGSLDNFYRCSRKIGALMISRKLLRRPAEIRVEPAYMRRAWGIRVTLHGSCGKRVRVMIPTITSSSKRSAQRTGESIAGEMATCLQCEYTLHRWH
jgi:hypothetical protein